MLKLLNTKDRAVLDGNPKGLVILTTQGVGAYSCSHCRHYNSVNQGGPTDQTCASLGVAPDAMPCGFSAKRPDRFFSPLPEAGPNAKRLMGRASLEDALLMLAMLPAHIQSVAEAERLKLPYRRGDAVSLIHDHALKRGVVVGFNAEHVWVEVGGGQPMMVPHNTVLPSKTQQIQALPTDR